MNIAIQSFINACIKPAINVEVLRGNTTNVLGLVDLITMLVSTGDWTNPLMLKWEFLYNSECNAYLKYNWELEIAAIDEEVKKPIDTQQLYVRRLELKMKINALK